MKKIISMLLVFAMSFSIGVTSLAAEINFGDVTKNDWFYDDIKTVVEMGLINGKSNRIYAPNDNLTYAEAIKLAACMNQFYAEGAVTLANGNPWYQPYVDYCFANGIIDKTYNYGEKATRAGYMAIFANALPNEALKEINNIPDNSIPDVPADKDYASSVYKLYRAGIINGVDDKHNCEPFVNISRKEVAVIVARMMNEKKRTHFTIVSVHPIQKDEDDTNQDEFYEVGEEAAIYEFFGFSSTPSDVSIDCGETATFKTEGLGGQKPYTYQWQYLNDDLWTDLEDTEDKPLKVTGTTQTTLTIETFVPGTTELHCVVTDSVGKSIATQPVKLIVNAVDWSYNTDEKVNINNKTDDNDNDNADNDVADDVDNDTADAADNNNKIYSEDNIIYYEDTNANEPAELKIERQPSNVSVEVEKTATFTVEVSGGTMPYNYQWQIKLPGNRAHWQNLEDVKGVFSGTKTESLSITGTAEGETTLRCVIIDNNGNKVTTASIKLTLTEKKKVLPTTRRNLS